MWHISLYSFENFTSAVFLFFLSVFVMLRGRGSAVHQSFGWWGLCAFTWLLTYGIAYATPSEQIAYASLKVGYTTILFIPSTFFQFTAEFLNHRIARKLVPWSYLFSLIFVGVLHLTNLFMEGTYQYFFGYYPDVGPAHPFFIAFVFLTVGSSHILLFSALRKQGVAENLKLHH